MTEEELTLYRLHLRIAVRDSLLRVLVEQVGMQPLGLQTLQGTVALIQRYAAQLTVPGVHPTESDLRASEAQEALREMLDGLGL